jgi:hypothetical protein
MSKFQTPVICRIGMTNISSYRFYLHTCLPGRMEMGDSMMDPENSVTFV